MNEHLSGRKHEKKSQNLIFFNYLLWRHNHENMIFVDETYLVYLLSTRISHLNSQERTDGNVTKKVI